MTAIHSYLACIALPKKRVAELNAMPERNQIRVISDDKVAICMNYTDGYFSKPKYWVCEPVIQKFGVYMKIEESSFWKLPEFVSKDHRIFPEKWHLRSPQFCTFHEKIFNVRTCEQSCKNPEG